MATIVTVIGMLSVTEEELLDSGTGGLPGFKMFRASLKTEDFRVGKTPPPHSRMIMGHVAALRFPDQEKESTG